MASTNSVVYDAMRVFKDSVFEHVRRYAKQCHGAKYLASLREIVGKERWDKAVRSATRLRTARVISEPLLDELDAQDVTILPKLFEQLYEPLTTVKGQRQELLSALQDVAIFRDGIAHPAFVSVSVEDARRLAARMSTAASTIFASQSPPLVAIEDAVNETFSYTPRQIVAIPKFLPPRQEILGQFVGRESELGVLYEWLASPVQLWVLEGDGGKGKSSLAFVFCESLQTAGEDIERVIWLSAKSRKYHEGVIRALEPDFDDLTSAFKAIAAAYGFGDVSASNASELEEMVVDLLRAFPALIVLDDIDSLDKENEDVAYWFTNTMARVAPRCKLLLTTRRELYGLGAYTSKIAGLNYDETKRFLRAASARAYGDPDKLGSAKTPKLLHLATDGSPLYLEDIVRLILISGKSPHEVVAEWKNVRGQDVREYALRREFEMLASNSKEVLLAAALAAEPISRAEILSSVGLSEDDLEAAISELQKFFLISPPDVAALTPTFEVNRNLAILVKSVMKNHPSFKKTANAVKQVRDTSGKPHKVAKDAQRAIREAVALVMRDNHPQAELLLKQYLEKYPDEGSLLSHLGWVLSRWPDGKRQTEAQAFLQRAVDVRHRSKATYVKLGELYIGNEMYERAETVLEVGRALFPDDLELSLMYAQAKASSALEVAGRVDSISVSGQSVVLDPLREALIDVMSVRKQLLTASDSTAYRGRLEMLGDLDRALRDSIDSVVHLS